jgi:hypothetical protein
MKRYFFDLRDLAYARVILFLGNRTFFKADVHPYG